MEWYLSLRGCRRHEREDLLCEPGMGAAPLRWVCVSTPHRLSAVLSLLEGIGLISAQILNTPGLDGGWAGTWMGCSSGRRASRMLPAPLMSSAAGTRARATPGPSPPGRRARAGGDDLRSRWHREEFSLKLARIRPAGSHQWSPVSVLRAEVFDLPGMIFSAFRELLKDLQGHAVSGRFRTPRERRPEGGGQVCRRPA